MVHNLPQNYVQCYVTSMRRRCLAVVNSGGTYPLLTLYGHWSRCRIWYRNIVIFTLFCDINDQVWSLLKYWKNVNFDFTIFEIVFEFLIFNFIWNKINAILFHISFIFAENLKMIWPVLMKIWAHSYVHTYKCCSVYLDYQYTKIQPYTSRVKKCVFARYSTLVRRLEHAVQTILFNAFCRSEWYLWPYILMLLSHIDLRTKGIPGIA